jgi:hypothetical protein
VGSFSACPAFRRSVGTSQASFARPRRGFWADVCPEPEKPRSQVANSRLPRPPKYRLHSSKTAPVPATS